MWNAMNVHFPVVFDDGVRWLVRVRRLRRDGPDPERQRRMVDSEAATMNALQKVVGDQIPRAWLVSSQDEGSNDPGEYE